MSGARKVGMSVAMRRQCDYRRSRGATVPLALYLVRHSSSNPGGTASQQCPFLHKVQDPNKARGQNSRLQSGAPGARSLHRGWLSKRGWLSNLSGTTTSGDPEIHLLSHHHFSGPGFGQPPLLRTTPRPPPKPPSVAPWDNLGSVQNPRKALQKLVGRLVK